MAWLGEHENLFYGKKISFEIKKGMKSGRRERKKSFYNFLLFHMKLYVNLNFSYVAQKHF